MNPVPRVTVVGAGLAGSECAWQLARRGIPVRLVEMKPARYSEAHASPAFAELVCSNTLKAEGLAHAPGLLQVEMAGFDSLIIRSARAHRVPAGQALAVDRDRFSGSVTAALEARPEIEIVRQEAAEIPGGETPCVIATGPLTSPALADALRGLFGADYLHFYDAIAPTVYRDSLDESVAYKAGRWGKGDDYWNCPLSRDDYEAFVDAVLASERIPLHAFENEEFYEFCLPIEVLARRGRDTLRFGPMRPVGLTDPRTGKRPHAVVQLRQEDAAAQLLSLVGFQNHLKFGDQARILRMIPGLANAEFARLGTIHRNAYLDSPRLLHPWLEAKTRPGLFLAGQITGVEGYLESAAMGLYAALQVARRLAGRDPLPAPATTMTGALARFITWPETKKLQPMKAVWGLLPMEEGRRLKKEAKRAQAARIALRDMSVWAAALGESWNPGEIPGEPPPAAG